ncbi:UvrD-helicase domain-containing protein [Adlercreutzia sp. ZJ242]|uniref:UvrD-helicase domain-containing protein n=1 Tax=Adlercreutzia sp. ZJ242 TaxID=2709409 RepID=UPI0013EA1DBB|nr:UvrD-helicase domain-containing protein [Adlercreutzia sp. ZJ242]
MNLDRCTPGQREIVTTLDAPLLVAAGAGSGKTFTLTQRVVNALAPAQGEAPCLDSIDQVLAITFTKKAASELKGRIKALLVSEGLRDQALAVDGAWISTIHGMAARILREHALELGLDPAFEVLPEADAELLRTQAVDAVVRRARESSDPLVRDLLASGLPLSDEGRGSSVTSQALRVLSRVEAMPEGFDGIALAKPQARPADLMRALYELGQDFRATAAAWAKPTKTEAQMLEALERALEGAQAWLSDAPPAAFDDPAFDAEAFRRALYAFPPTSAQFHAKKDDAGFFASYRSEYARLSEEAEACCAYRTARALVSFARLISDEFSRLKGPSRLDNADLLAQCARALATRPALAERYRRQFKLIMVDEFQDTDKLQVFLISALAAPGLANVCTVGDAQQSIYRFRGADVNVFFAYRDSLRQKSADARFVSLPDNFRSHADVLKLVDAVFAQQRVFGREFLHLEPRGAVNAAADPVFADHPRISFDFVHYKGSTSKARGVSKAEAVVAAARHVAQHFACLRARGARAGDMALLLGGMGNAGVYARELRRVGLESVIAGGSVFASSQEAQLVASLLRVAVNGDDEPALFSVLTSPLFALADDVLLALATARDEAGEVRPRSLSRGFADAREGAVSGLASGDEQALAMARAHLGRFAARARKGGATEALRRLFAETGLLDRLEDAGAPGLAAAGNLAKALSLVRGFEGACSGASSVCLAYADHLRCAKEAPGALATVESDFVRIMTVHASKGLEFPHVAVADLGSGVASRESLVVENVGERTYVAASAPAAGECEKVITKLRGFEREDALCEDAAAARTPGELFSALSAYARSQSLAEAQRLLYVALTRASRSLLLSGVFRSKPQDGYEKAGIYGDLHAALGWDVESEKSVSMVDYGGSAPARVTLEYLTASGEGAAPGGEGAPASEDVPASEGAVASESTSASEGVAGGGADASAGDGAPAGEEDAKPAAFRVPARPALRMPSAAPHAFGREDVRSYSSLEHDPLPWELLGRAAQLGAAPAAAPAAGAAAAQDVAARVVEDDDATALGTAFHRLAQRMVLEAAVRPAPRALEKPAREAVRAQAQRAGLTPDQARRLDEALDLWAASDVARELGSFAQIAAEVPFMVDVGPAGAPPLYLEGALDALALDGTGCALVVDYKTGGSPAETDAFVRAKHELQAQCYAYALLKEGVSEVEARFVRVEHRSGGNPAQPQVATYRFDASDVEALEDVIRKHA